MFTCISLNTYYIEMFYVKSRILMASVCHVVCHFFGTMICVSKIVKSLSSKVWTVAIVVHCCESQLYLRTITCAFAWIRILFIFLHVTPMCLDPVMCIFFSLCLCYQLLVVISATRLHYRPGKQVGRGRGDN